MTAGRVDEEQVRRAYGEVADLYVELFGAADAVHPDDLDLIGRHLSGRPGPVLDVGCGPGHLTAWLCSQGAAATGIDIVPRFLAHARAAHPGVAFRRGSLADLGADPGVADGSVAGILAWYSLIHLPPADVDGVLAGFRRVLAPGGRLVVGFVDGAEVEPFDHKVVTAYRWPPDELAARLAGAGFTEIERHRRPADDAQPRPHAALALVLGHGLGVE
jgi:SAM-dependent methyltransferase